MFSVASDEHVTLGGKSGRSKDEPKIQWDVGHAAPQQPYSITFNRVDKEANDTLYTASVRVANSGDKCVAFKYRLNLQHGLCVKPYPVGWLQPNDIVDFVLNINRSNPHKQLLMQLQLIRVPRDFVSPMAEARDIFEDHAKYKLPIEKYTYPVIFTQRPLDTHGVREQPALNVNDGGDNTDTEARNLAVQVQSSGELDAHGVFTAEDYGNEADKAIDDVKRDDDDQDQQEYDDFLARCQIRTCCGGSKLTRRMGPVAKCAAIGTVVVCWTAGIAYMLYSLTTYMQLTATA